jgi:hypothetical protein
MSCAIWAKKVSLQLTHFEAAYFALKEFNTPTVTELTDFSTVVTAHVKAATMRHLSRSQKSLAGAVWCAPVGFSQNLVPADMQQTLNHLAKTHFLPNSTVRLCVLPVIYDLSRRTALLPSQFPPPPAGCGAAFVQTTKEILAF